MATTATMPIFRTFARGDGVILKLIRLRNSENARERRLVSFAAASFLENVRPAHESDLPLEMTRPQLVRQFARRRAAVTRPSTLAIPIC